jgi:hypothetical protein
VTKSLRQNNVNVAVVSGRSATKEKPMQSNDAEDLSDKDDEQAEPILSLLKKLRSSARTNRRLHFDPEEREILLEDEIYQLLCQREAKVMRKLCALDADNDNSLGIIGSGSGRTTEPGASAGSSAAETEVVSRGARLRLSEARSELLLRKKQLMR